MVVTMLIPHLSVEGHEEDEVLDPSDSKHQGGGDWVVAFEDERLEGVEEDEDELDELDGGEVLLPPEVRLQRGPARRQQVVEVHQRVDARVEEGTEATLTTADKPRPPPAEEGQCAVMDHMQGREVAKLLLGNEEEGVEEVNEL